MRKVETFVITGDKKVDDSTLYKLYTKLNLWNRNPELKINTTVINDKIELRLDVTYDENEEN